MKFTMRMVLAAAALAVAGAVGGQSFPSRPVTLTVGFAPGGGTDTAARIIAQKLEREPRSIGRRRQQGGRRRQHGRPAHRHGGARRLHDPPHLRRSDEPSLRIS